MIYCFDIDGTICSSVKNSDYASAIPYEDVIKKINYLYDKGNKIIFMTARGSVSKKDWTEFTERQLSSWGVKYHELITNKKPHADFFIDDKAINVEDWRRSFGDK
jgi:histidinol phosphatase-like enzyme